MATKILANHSISAAPIDTDALVSVGDAVFHVKVTGAGSDTAVTYALKGKEGDADYDEIRNGHKNGISFQTVGNNSYRIAIAGINSESVILSLKFTGEKAGIVTIEATKNTNPLT